MMEPPDRFIFRREDFEANTRVALRELREESEFFDVTLVSGDGDRVQASKVILAAGSSFFHKILRENPHPHPLIYLKGVDFKHLLSVLDFLYTGEASIAEEDVNQFVDIAADLKIKGFPATALDRPQNQITVGNSSPSEETHPYSSRYLPLKEQVPAEEDGQVAAEKVGQVAEEAVQVAAEKDGQVAAEKANEEADEVAAEKADEVAEEAGLSHGISREDIEETAEVTEQESSPVSKVFNSQSFASSNGQNSIPQSTRKEDHGASCDVKEEVSNNDMELVTKWSQIEPEVVIFEAADGIFDWYQRDKEGDTEEHDENIELDIRNVDVKEERMDSTPNIENAKVKDNSENLDPNVKNTEQTIGNDTNDSTKPTLKQGEKLGEFHQEKFISGSTTWIKRDVLEEMLIKTEVDQDNPESLVHSPNVDNTSTASINREKIPDSLISIDETFQKENNSHDEAPVYGVTCKETRGEFHREKFISGSNGLCILSYGIWMTPNDFQTMAGSRAKKYKQSLRVNGKPISELIDPNGDRPNTPSVQHYKKENVNSDKIKLVKNYESFGASSTLKNDQDESLNTGDDIISSDYEIDLSGSPFTMSLQENNASKDESYVMKVGQSNLDESFTEDAILIDFDNIDKYGSLIGSKTRIKQVSDKDVSEIVNLVKFEKEKNGANESTDCNVFDTPKSDVKKHVARFSASQTSGLQKAFNENNFLSKEKAQSLSRELGMTEKQAKIWFNNSRAQQSKKMLGEIQKKNGSNETDCNKFSKSDAKKDNDRFSDSQTSGLRKAFNENNFLSKEKAQSLSEELGITEKQAKIWFNNSRAQQRKETLKKVLGKIQKYSCESCSRAFVNKSKFKKHMSSHDIWGVLSGPVR